MTTDIDNIILPFNDGSPGWRDDPAPAPRPPLRMPGVMDMPKFLSCAAPEPDHVLPGLEAGDVGSIVAAGATGKSLLALQILVACAGGADLLELGKAAPGWAPGCADVMYLCAEDRQNIVWRRIQAMAGRLTAEQKDAVGRHLHAVPLRGCGARLDDYEWRKAIEDGAAGKRLVILDTLRRFHQADENDGTAMAELIMFMEQISAGTGAAIVFLHHTSKDAARSGTAGEQQASRGSSVLTDNVRWQVNLATMAEKEAAKAGVPETERRRHVKLVLSKINYGGGIPDLWFVRGAGGVLLPESTIASALADHATKKEAQQARAAARAGKKAPAAAAAVDGDGDLPIEPVRQGANRV